MVKAPPPNPNDAPKSHSIPRLNRKPPGPLTASEALARRLNFEVGGAATKKPGTRAEDPIGRPWQETMRKYVFYGPPLDVTWSWEEIGMDPPAGEEGKRLRGADGLAGIRAQREAQREAQRQQDGPEGPQGAQRAPVAQREAQGPQEPQGAPGAPVAPAAPFNALEAHLAQADGLLALRDVIRVVIEETPPAALRAAGNRAVHNLIDRMRAEAQEEAQQVEPAHQEEIHWPQDPQAQDVSIAQHMRQALQGREVAHGLQAVLGGPQEDPRRNAAARRNRRQRMIERLRELERFLDEEN